MALVHVGNNLAIARTRDLLVCFYNEVPGLDFFQRLREAENQVLAAHPRGLLIFNVLKRPGKMFTMPSEARQAATALGTEMSPRTVVIANVVEGTGFFAATARALIAGTAVINQVKTPQQTFEDMDQALAWFLPLANDGNPAPFTAAEIRAAIHEATHATPAS